MELTEGYKIVPYRPEFLDQIATEVMIYLWGSDPNKHKEYFSWKYNDNPYTEYPLGIVALHNDNVVGFRGYFAENWQVKDKQFKVLVAGDTCVIPGHRRKGLSVAMGYAAIDEYASEFTAFLNFSSTNKSKRGYEKLGFVPLIDKYELERYASCRDVRADGTAGNFEVGYFGDIIISKTPMPKEMYELTSKYNLDDKRFTLIKDEQLFRWRFKNNRNKYVFCYYIHDNIVTDYVVFGETGNYNKGHILDHTENDLDAINKILQYVVDMKFFNIVTVGNFSLCPDFSKLLESLGFKANYECHRDPEPLIVRTSKKDCVEDDWFVGGLDIRKIENWKMEGICSEWA